MKSEKGSPESSNGWTTFGLLAAKIFVYAAVRRHIHIFIIKGVSHEFEMRPLFAFVF